MEQALEIAAVLTREQRRFLAQSWGGVEAPESLHGMVELGLMTAEVNPDPGSDASWWVLTEEGERVRDALPASAFSGS